MWIHGLQNNLSPQFQPEIPLSLVNFLSHPIVQNITNQMQSLKFRLMAALSHTLSRWPWLLCHRKDPWDVWPALSYFDPTLIFPYHFPLRRTGSPFSNMGFGSQPSWLLRGFFPSSFLIPSIFQSHVLYQSLSIILEIWSNFSYHHNTKIKSFSCDPTSILATSLAVLPFIDELLKHSSMLIISTSTVLPCSLMHYYISYALISPQNLFSFR